MSNPNSYQHGGNHYKGTTYQHWDFAMRALEGRYLEGNITKYVARHRKKNGLEDLLKARHYLDKLLEEHRLGNVQPLYAAWRTHHESPSHFCDVNGLVEQERALVLLISNWHNRESLLQAARILDDMIIAEESAPVIKPMSRRFADLENVMDIACRPGNVTDDYQRGLANGLILADACLKDKSPEFIPPEAVTAAEPNRAYVAQGEEATGAGQTTAGHRGTPAG